MWCGAPSGAVLRWAQAEAIEVPGDGSVVTVPARPVAGRADAFRITADGDIILTDGAPILMTFFIRCRVDGSAAGYREIGLLNVTPSPSPLQPIDTREGSAASGGQIVSGTAMWEAKVPNTVRLGARQTSGAPLVFDAWVLGAWVVGL